MLTVIIYDVTDDKRREKLRKLLRHYGVAAQKSAFEARLTSAEKKTLVLQVSRLLDPNEDRFAIYPIPLDLESSVVALGLPRPCIEVQNYYIL
jgi:CRISPR-associated protein Cas2